MKAVTHFYFLQRLVGQRCTPHKIPTKLKPYLTLIVKISKHSSIRDSETPQQEAEAVMFAAENICLRAV